MLVFGAGLIYGCLWFLAGGVVSVGMCCMGIVGCCGWFWFVVDWFVVG